MATVTANKMKSVICKGKLPAIEVARLIHQHHVQGLRGIEPTGITETELKKLASNINRSEWVGYSHWVDEGIDLLYAFAMKIKSDAALAAVHLYQLNRVLTMVIPYNKAERLNNLYDKWKAISLSIRVTIHRTLWYHEALRVAGEYMKSDWTLIASRGMEAMLCAIEQINGAIEDNNLAPYDIEALKPSEVVIKEWKTLIEEVEIRSFLLAVTECEVEISRNK